MGGGKSWYLSAEAILNAMKYPGNRLVILRKERTVLERNFLPTFFTICPMEIIKKFNQSKLTIEFINGSLLMFMEADKSKDPLLNKIKGLEVGWVGIDEANELDESVFNTIKTRLRWKLPNGGKPNYQIRLTSNPENCWLIPYFLESKDPKHKFIQSLTTDNYAEDDPYLEMMKDAYKHHPELLERYLNGLWEFGSGINQLIRNELLAFMRKDILIDGDEMTSMGVDPARYGDDEAVFTVKRGPKIVHVEIWSKSSVSDLAKVALRLMEEYSIYPWKVGIDVIGVGAGVVDILVDGGYEVEAITVGNAPEINIYSNEFKFLQPKNLRAQLFMALRNDIAGEQVTGLMDAKYYKDGELVGCMADEIIKELSWIEYKFADSKTMQIVSKEVIKKKHGKSPGLADAISICNWMSRKTYGGGYVG